MEASIATFRPNMVLMSWSVMALGAARGLGRPPVEQRSARKTFWPAGGWREGRGRTQIGQERGESFDTHGVVLALGRRRGGEREGKGGSIWGFGWSASRHSRRAA